MRGAPGWQRLKICSVTREMDQIRKRAELLGFDVGSEARYRVEHPRLPAGLDEPL